MCLSLNAGLQIQVLWSDPDPVKNNTFIQEKLDEDESFLLADSVLGAAEPPASGRNRTWPDSAMARTST